MKKVVWSVLLLTLIFVSSILAGAGKKVTLVWWSPEGQDLAKPYYEIAEAFEKVNPGIEVKIQYVSSDGYTEKFLAGFAAGKGPDIFFNFDLRGLGMRGAAEELTPYINGTDGVDLNIYNVDLLKRWLFIDDKIYTMPRDIGLMAIFYNKDLFDEAGVPYPDPDWDLEEFVAIAKKLTIPEKRQYGSEMISGEEIREAFGAKIFDDSMRKVLINSPEYIKALQWEIDLELKHKVSPPPSVMQTLGAGAGIEGGGPVELFNTGKIAMVKADYWGVAQFKEAGLNFGVVPLPHRKGSNVYEGWVGTWSMSGRSKHKKEGWKLLKFMTGPEGSAIMAKHWAIPAVKSVMAETKWEDDPYNKVFADMLKKGTPFKSWYNTPDCWNVLGPMFSLVDILREGKVPIEKAVADAAKEIQAKLDRAWAEIEK